MKKVSPDEPENRRATSTEQADALDDEALDRIYERYGSDLAAFFRDAYKETALQQQKLERSAKDNVEAVTVP